MKVPSWTARSEIERNDAIRQGGGNAAPAAAAPPASNSVAAYPPPVQGTVPYPLMPPVLPPPGPHPRGISAEAISAAGAISTAGAISPVGISTAGAYPPPGQYPPPAGYPLWVYPPLGHIRRRGHIRCRGISATGSRVSPGRTWIRSPPLPAHQTSNYGGNFLQPFMGRLAANVIADGVWAVLGSVSGP
ncbi:hypothetical protein NL676_030455 [Syzygium grande]|nr:hypothetical protein NL676_030455 [Syzygium grande]